MIGLIGLAIVMIGVVTVVALLLMREMYTGAMDKVQRQLFDQAGTLRELRNNTERLNYRVERVDKNIEGVLVAMEGGIQISLNESTMESIADAVAARFPAEEEEDDE